MHSTRVAGHSAGALRIHWKDIWHGSSPKLALLPVSPHVLGQFVAHGRLPPPSLLVTASFLLGTTLLKDSLKGRKASYGFDKVSLLLRKLWHRKLWRNWITLLAVGQMCLAFIERPSGFTLHSHQKIFSSWPLELVICLFYVLDLWLNVVHRGWRKAIFGWHRVEVGITCVFLLDIITSASGLIPFQFSRFFRPLFIISKRRHIRFYFSSILAAVPSMVPVMMFLLLTIFVGAFMGTVLFSSNTVGAGALASLNSTRIDAPPYCSVFTTECTDYFQDVSIAMYTTFDLTKKTNWPLVMLPLLEIAPASGLFFVAFQLLAHFFVFRLLLASAFSSFTAQNSVKFLVRQHLTRAAVHQAFTLLADVPNGMTLKMWRKVAAEVAPWHSQDALDVLFITARGQQELLREEGFALASRLLSLGSTPSHMYEDAALLPQDMQGRAAPTAQSAEGQLQQNRTGGDAAQPLLGQPAPARAQSQVARCRARLRDFCQWKAVVWVLDAAILAAVGIELALTAAVFDGSGSATALRNLVVLSDLVVIAFLAEAILKVFALGPTAYWSDAWHKLDATVVLASTAALILQSVNAQRSASMLKVTILLRMGRILRVLRVLKRFDTVLMAIRRILPMIWRLGCVLFIVLYTWSILGMEAFAGTLSRSNTRVVASSYGERGFWVLNFDSFYSACITVFSLLLETQSPMLAEGAMAAYDSWGPMVFFVAYTVTVVWLVSTVIVALIVQGFSAQIVDLQLTSNGAVHVWRLLTAQAQIKWSRTGSQRRMRQWLQFHQRGKLMNINNRLYGRSAMVTLHAYKGHHVQVHWPDIAQADSASQLAPPSSESAEERAPLPGHGVELSPSPAARSTSQTSRHANHASDAPDHQAELVGLRHLALSEFVSLPHLFAEAVEADADGPEAAATIQHVQSLLNAASKQLQQVQPHLRSHIEMPQNLYELELRSSFT